MDTDFFPALLEQAGITSGNRQRVLNLGNSLCSFGCSLAGSLVIDHVGRRPMFFIAESVAISGLAIIAGLVAPGGSTAPTRANAGIAFMS